MSESVACGTALPAVARPVAARPPLAAYGALLALMVAAFSYVTTESLPIGLIQVIAADLNVSLPAVGLLVTGYGLTVAVVSVPLAYVTRGVPRRVLLAALLTVFVLATLVSAATASYWVLMAARVLTALSQALFWAVAVATAASLFPPRVRGRVVAAVISGASLAPALGVPAGTWLGQQAGWRVAFLALTGFGVVALVAIVLLLPSRPAGPGGAAPGVSPDIRRYWIVVVTTGLVITGVFAAFTYITAFLTDVSGFSAAAISPLLLVYGAATTVGAISAGPLADRSPRAAMIAPTALLTLTLLGLQLFGTVRFAVIGLVAVLGLALATLVVGLQSRALQVAPRSQEMASAAYSAAFNLGIGGGALVGGLLLDAFGVRGTTLAGGLLTAVALVVLLAEPLIAGRRAPRPIAD